MKQSFKKAMRLALVLGGMLLVAGSAVQADMVTFATTGNFGSPVGPSTYTGPGISIVFNSAVNSATTTPSQVSFGTFDTSASSAGAPVAIPATSFYLNIFQTAPTLGNITFLGTMSGTLSGTSSNAFVQFAGPLSQNIGGITYTILSGDSGSPGRVNLSSPTTNAGLSTIAGYVTAVPEPSSMALVAIGSSVAVVIGLRSRRRMQAESIA